MANFKRSAHRKNEQELEKLLAVLKAFKAGEHSQRMPTDWTGVYAEIAETMNEIVDLSYSTTSGFLDVFREVGEAGLIGARVVINRHQGVRLALAEAINAMLDELLTPLNEVMDITSAVARGDLSQRVPIFTKGRQKEGQFLAWAETLNAMMDRLATMVSEVSRVTRELGVEGKLGSRATVLGVEGIWRDLTDNVNSMADTRTAQLRDLAKVATAITQGNLRQKITMGAQGEVLQINDTVNTMVDQLSTFASEVSRVSREVGTEGKLGGQVAVSGASGTWKDLIDNVNSMIASLASQVRAIAEVTTAVANGDLSHKIMVESRGEFLPIKETINNKVDHLNTFADEVTRVAREVGVEGKLGGQAFVPGVSGTWKDLTENVNVIASNLTEQVRGIAKVVTALAKGDSEGALDAFASIADSATVSSKGEMAELKENLNEMIRIVRLTDSKKSEEDWLKTNLAKFSRVLQGQRDLVAVSRTVLSELAPLVNVQHGVFYLLTESGGDPRLRMLSSYAYKERVNLAKEWKVGEGLIGQCALEKKRILLNNVPDDYIHIASGLGEAKPLNIMVLPVMFEDRVVAVIELASFEHFSTTHQAFLDQLAESIGIVFNTIEASMRTEDLLKQSQTLTEELQSQQEELRQINEELQEKAQLLQEQKVEVESKNREVEQAKAEVEEKASQLALTSKYKSEFLSSMSHELRTPLNSLLILSEQLAGNQHSHLDNKEVEIAKLIHVSGNDLLLLINDILDLSKIESGTVSMDLSEVSFTSIKDQIERTFRHVANNQGLRFEISFARDLSRTIVTDELRLLQVLKNLLSNSFKFTEKGKVSVRVNRALTGWNSDNENLNNAKKVFAFSVVDTGIGISTDKQRIIFEAFQQGEGGTARKYGGTGLGLSISREIARLLGGELKLASSTLKQGSTFVLYVPQNGGGQSSLSADHAVESSSPAHTVRVTNESMIADDRDLIEQGDRVLLIIEDDPVFAKIVLDLARERGFRGIVASRGAQALELAHTHKPNAITLDIQLPDLDGWALLDTFKRDPELRHIPVDIISVEDEVSRGLALGAHRYLTKPVNRDEIGAAMDTTRRFLNRPVKNLLLVASNEQERAQLIDLLDNSDINIQNADTGKAGLTLIGRRSFDCVVVGVQLHDMRGVDFIAEMRKKGRLAGVPAVIYGSAPLPDVERAALEELGTHGVTKSVDSPDRLLDQTALFLHRVISHLPEDKRKILQQFERGAHNLGGKNVLIVDDDRRNIFALTTALERKGVIVSSVENGRAAIDRLNEVPSIELVLMDIMMPGMDGYETMREIRSSTKFKQLPIIALTAKAMVGDREKCLEAGASDYLSKPVNIDQLTSLMQVWLSR